VEGRQVGGQLGGVRGLDQDAERELRQVREAVVRRSRRRPAAADLADLHQAGGDGAQQVQKLPQSRCR
jgi:hypothetical protein